MATSSAPEWGKRERGRGGVLGAGYSLGAPPPRGTCMTRQSARHSGTRTRDLVDGLGAVGVGNVQRVGGVVHLCVVGDGCGGEPKRASVPCYYWRVGCKYDSCWLMLAHLPQTQPTRLNARHIPQSPTHRTRMEPFLRAKLTSSVSWARVAAAPVGLLGEQKKMMSVRLACEVRGGWVEVGEGWIGLGLGPLGIGFGRDCVGVAVGG